MRLPKVCFLQSITCMEEFEGLCYGYTTDGIAVGYQLAFDTTYAAGGFSFGCPLCSHARSQQSGPSMLDKLHSPLCNRAAKPSARLTL